MDYNDYNYKQPHFDSRDHTPPRHSWDTSEVTIGTWIVVLILIAIPFVGFIVLLVLAFGDHNESLKNFAKATLILLVIGFFLTMLGVGCSI
ncbi:hypothetical protein B4U37_02760 [Sutcliffiella horikoshii]|uniref:Uncharacterized protein n=1 Tax=Sutcliffiella horikoshii TaxID=79883 RepID=A0ABM6KFI2_9BACI|nr:hypothetical protein [Sutcliffiella horikoshii]ART75029.1 hypothetical protein B4U37_02760 [Sutcliffiella horikoshii]